MEKINTPLGELRDTIQLRIDELNREKETHYASFNEHGVDVCDTVINELSLIKEKIFHSLPTEREMIEKAYIQACHDSQNFDMDLSDYSELEHYANDHFTQTFKSYE